MAGRAKAEEYRRFISERGLSGSFRSYRRLKSARKRTITVHQKNYDGSVSRRKVYVLKEHGRTVFRDFRTMHVLATTKRTIPQAIKGVFSERRIKGRIVYDDWKIERDQRREDIRLKNVQEMVFLKGDIERTHRLSDRAPRKAGQVIVDATYYAADGTGKRVQARSRHGFLGTASIRKELLGNAIRNGAYLAGFSPVSVIVHGWWYEWVTDRRIKRYH